MLLDILIENKSAEASWTLSFCFIHLSIEGSFNENTGHASKISASTPHILLSYYYIRCCFSLLFCVHVVTFSIGWNSKKALQQNVKPLFDGGSAQHNRKSVAEETIVMLSNFVWPPCVRERSLIFKQQKRWKENHHIKWCRIMYWHIILVFVYIKNRIFSHSGIIIMDIIIDRYVQRILLYLALYVFSSHR